MGRSGGQHQPTSLSLTMQGICLALLTSHSQHHSLHGPQEGVALVTAQQGAPVPAPSLQQLAAVWAQRWPPAATAAPDAALTVHHVRGLLLEALQPRVGSQV